MAFSFGSIGQQQAGQVASGAVGGITGGMQEQIRQWGNFIIPCGLYSPQEAFLPFVMGLVPNDVFDNFRKYNGLALTPWERDDYSIAKFNEVGEVAVDFVKLQSDGHVNNKILQISGKQLTTHDTHEMFNRGIISEDMARFQYEVNAGGDEVLATGLAKMRFQVPGPSDLIHFAVRDSYDPVIVQRFQYNKELPVEILPAMKAQGYHGEVGIPIPPGATTTTGPDTRTKAQWFDLYWWSHWQLPSVTQGYEMLHRLYPVSPWGASPEVTPTNSFVQADLNLLLKANDYPPFWRERMTTISYSPLTRVDVRRMHFLGIMDNAQVYHAFRAGGYDDRNAERLMRFTVEMNERSLYGPTSKATVKEIEFAFKQGIIDAPEVRMRMNDLYIDQRTVGPLIELWSLQYTNLQIRDSLKAIKSAFLLGGLTLGQTTTALMNLGFEQKVREDYIRLWSMIRNGKRKFLSATVNLRHYKRFMITRNQLILKLTNLNFDPKEITAMVSYADAEIDAMRRKEIVKQITQAAKQAEKQAAQHLKAVLAPYTDEMVVAFYEQDGISLEQVYMIQNLKGWADTTIQDWIRVKLQREVTPDWMNEVKKKGKLKELQEIETIY